VIQISTSKYYPHNFESPLFLVALGTQQENAIMLASLYSLQSINAFFEELLGFGDGLGLGRCLLGLFFFSFLGFSASRHDTMLSNRL